MNTRKSSRTTNPALTPAAASSRRPSRWKIITSVVVACLTVAAPVASHAQTPPPSRVIGTQRTGYFGVIPGQTMRINVLMGDGSVAPAPAIAASLGPVTVFAQVAFFDENGKLLKTSDRVAVVPGKLFFADCPVDPTPAPETAGAEPNFRMPIRAEVQYSIDARPANTRFAPRLGLDLESAACTLEIFDSNTKGILIGLLLPAVQRVREAAAFPAPQ